MGIADTHRARCGTTRQRGAHQQGHRDKAFRVTPHGADPPHKRLHQTRAHLPRATRPRGRLPHVSVVDSFDNTSSRKAWPASELADTMAFCAVGEMGLPAKYVGQGVNTVST